MEVNIKKAGPFKGEMSVPGDKSISHRAVMLGAIARGETRIRGFLPGEDCLSTIGCFRRLGIDIRQDGEEVTVAGKGLHGLSAPEGTLDAGNSGTTLRLLSGILAGQAFESRLTGDASLCRRPMDRIMKPLSLMGAQIASERENRCAPLIIEGGRLSGIDYVSPVASAQVKSCVLLAGLYADGPTSVTEPAVSRDHSEIMLSHFGAVVQRDGKRVSIEPEPALSAREISVPGDISSAAYFIAAALLVPGSRLLIKNVGLNPTRDGFLTVCRAMGADITVLNRRSEGEPSGDLLVRSGTLKGVTIGGELIPTLIDELPMAAVLGAFAEGETVIRDASELRVKESDRIAVMTEALTRMGAQVTPTEDGMIIRGGLPLTGTRVDSHGDHRVAMALSVAGLVCRGELTIENGECVSISYPDFYRDLYGCA